VIDHATRQARRVIEINMAPSPPREHDDAVDRDAHRPLRRLGAGRSAVVWLVGDGRTEPRARKIFTGDPLAKLVHIACTGAPNPYAWNDDAIHAALARRRILARLVEHWFGDRLRLPALHSAAWDEPARAWRLDMEYIGGRGPALRHALPRECDSEMRELVREIMVPLQARLRESGFDGLLWQAGLGNPVASSNFMLELEPADPSVKRTRTGERVCESFVVAVR